MTSPSLTAVLLGAAAAAALLRAPPRRPLPSPLGGERRQRPAARSHTASASPAAAAAACTALALSTALLLGGPLGWLAAAAVVLRGPVLLRRLERGAARREREECARDAPLALDLLAACLAGGAPLPAAAAAVAEAVGGGCGARLRAVSVRAVVGSAASDVWRELSPAGDDALAPAARALARAADGGAPVAAAVARCAAEVRADVRARQQQAARRVGVLAAAPLGLCFLPAFVLLGVAPVVVALAGPALDAV